MQTHRPPLQAPSYVAMREDPVVKGFARWVRVPLKLLPGCPVSDAKDIVFLAPFKIVFDHLQRLLPVPFSSGQEAVAQVFRLLPASVLVDEDHQVRLLEIFLQLLLSCHCLYRVPGGPAKNKLEIWDKNFDPAV